MKVILYTATSIDGFLAKKDGDSDWVSEVDTPIFEEKIKETGCIIIGNNTYKQFYQKIYPVKDVLNIVISSSDNPQFEDGVIFVKTPNEAIQKATDKGFNSVLIVGGGKTNGSFLDENLVDEIYIDIHLLILGNGIKVFDGFDGERKVELLDQQKLSNGQILLHYKIVK